MAKKQEDKQQEKKKKEPKKKKPAAPSPAPRLLTRYSGEIRQKMVEKFGYKNPMEIPKLIKMTVSMGVGEGTKDIKVLENAEAELGLITGQKAKRTRATKSIASEALRLPSASTATFEPIIPILSAGFSALSNSAVRTSCRKDGVEVWSTTRSR